MSRLGLYPRTAQSVVLLPEIAKLRMPVLIIQGMRDFEAMPSKATQLAVAVPRATTLTVSSMNHVLKLTPANRSHRMALPDRLISASPDRLWTRRSLRGRAFPYRLDRISRVG